MADLIIDNQKDFFEKVRILDTGEVATVLVAKTGAEVRPMNAETFFKLIALDENGNIKTCWRPSRIALRLYGQREGEDRLWL